MSQRLLLWLWAAGTLLATATILLFIWQLHLASLFTGLLLVFTGVWLLFGSAVATACNNFSLALKLQVLCLVPLFSAAGTTMLLPEQTGVAANTIAGGAIFLFIVGIGLFCFAGDRENDHRKKQDGTHERAVPISS